MEVMIFCLRKTYDSRYQILTILNHYLDLYLQFSISENDKNIYYILYINKLYLCFQAEFCCYSKGFMDIILSYLYAHTYVQSVMKSLIIVTDAFDGRIVENKAYKDIVDLENISKSGILKLKMRSSDGLNWTAEGYIVGESLIKLQDSGVTFKKTYCDSPLCVPSRAALLSGKAGA